MGKQGDPLSLNLYTYCHNNPIANVDPSGHIKIPKWVKDVAIGGVGKAYDTIETAIAVKDTAKRLHYNRNALNTDLPQTSEKAVGWDGTVSASAHQFSAPNKDNRKYVSPDGRKEVIFDADDNIVTDPRDVGTYNFYPSNQGNRLKAGVGHFVFDVAPWIVWGNTPEDTTTTVERVDSLLPEIPRVPIYPISPINTK